MLIQETSYLYTKFNILISAPRYYALRCTKVKFPHSILSANFANNSILHLDAADQLLRNMFKIMHRCAVSDPVLLGKFRTFHKSGYIQKSDNIKKITRNHSWSKTANCMIPNTRCCTLMN